MASARAPTVRAGADSSAAHRWWVAYERHGRQRSAAASERDPLAPAFPVPDPLAAAPPTSGRRAP